MRNSNVVFVKRCSVRLYLQFCLRRYNVLFTLFVSACVYWCSTYIDYVNNIADVLIKAGTAGCGVRLSSLSVFASVRDANLYCSLCCVVALFVFELCRVSCVPKCYQCLWIVQSWFLLRFPLQIIGYRKCKFWYVKYRFRFFKYTFCYVKTNFVM
jgi:hypothetical protein